MYQQLGTGEGSHGSNPQSCSMRPRVGWPLGDGDCHVMYGNLTVVHSGNVFGKCHAPCTLKMSFENE